MKTEPTKSVFKILKPNQPFLLSKIEPIWSILVGLDHFIYFSYTLNQELFQRKWNFTYKYDFDLSLRRMYCDSLAQLIFKSIFQKLKIKDFFE